VSTTPSGFNSFNTLSQTIMTLVQTYEQASYEGIDDVLGREAHTCRWLDRNLPHLHDRRLFGPRECRLCAGQQPRRWHCVYHRKTRLSQVRGLREEEGI
jgi:hypothetical protein